MAEIVNKIKQSKLRTIDLEKMAEGFRIKELDLKNYLFRELILKEKEFREEMEAHNWEQYEGSVLAVYCSSDAIIPKWAYMLVAQHAQETVDKICFGDQKSCTTQLLIEKIEHTDWSEYDDLFVLLKGCSKLDIPAEVYMKATTQLLPHVRKLMYGEACSNVPIYKKPRK